MESTIFPTSAIAAVAEDIHFSMLKAAAGRRAESKPYRFFTCRISNGSRLICKKLLNGPKFFSYESSMIRNGKLEISHCDYVQNCVRNGKKLVELFGVSTNTTTAMIMHGVPLRLYHKLQFRGQWTTARSSC